MTGVLVFMAVTCWLTLDKMMIQVSRDNDVLLSDTDLTLTQIFQKISQPVIQKNGK